MSILASAWARIAAAGAIAAAAFVFLARVFRAGREAERAAATEAALRHQTETASQARRSDDAVSDPRSARARRIRRLFQRD